MPITEAAPLEEFLEHLNVTTTDDEGELLRILRAATGAAENVMGPIVIREVTETVRSSGDLLLSHYPIASLTSLVHAQAFDGPYTGLDVYLDDEVGLVQSRLAGRRFAAGRWTATYLAGRWATASDVDEDVRLAVCIIGKHLWETQRGRASRPGMLGRQSSVDETEKVPSGFLIPNRARALLDRFARPDPSVA